MQTPNNQGMQQPPQTAYSPPPFTGHHDHSFTLQAIMELQKSTGKLEATMEAQCALLKKLDEKLDKVSDDVAYHNKIVFAATAIISVVVALGCYASNKAIEFGLDQIKEKSTIIAPTNHTKPDQNPSK